ncbi:hypothetical protein LJK88_43450 [Paenibacillus sp. P26]|nr:hypothetical protein LJK88_43450 [Paenibacillus sp. P26]
MKAQEDARPESYLRTVRQFADHVLRHGRDTYGEASTPLFVDGFHADTHEPVSWHSGGERWILSNQANQQNLFRTLTGLSVLTGEPRYKEVAAEAVRYGLNHLRYGKLIYWGGHLAFDLLAKRPVYASDKGPQHELKCHYPFYELMFELDREETARYIEGLWDSHVRDWSNLEFSRHGKPREHGGKEPVWERPYAGGEVFFTGEGLTFINAGGDLYYAATHDYRSTGNEAALEWAKRLARRYADTRHPGTGMGGYQFNISVLPGVRGDRAIDQFAERLKGRRVMEATLSVARQIHTITAEAALCRFALADALGPKGAEFGRLAVEDLLAYGEHAYEAETASFHPVLTDGTRLTGLVMEKSGYYGRQGDTLKATKADLLQLWSYLKGFRLTGDGRLWEWARSMAAGTGLGEIGESPGAEPALHPGESSEPSAVFALLELYGGAGHPAYLEAACAVGDNIVARRFHKSVFLAEPNRTYAKLDAVEPLALLHLAGELTGRRKEVPVYCGSKAFFGAAYDGHGHMIDNSFIYSRRL